MAMPFCYFDRLKTYSIGEKPLVVASGASIMAPFGMGITSMA